MKFHTENKALSMFSVSSLTDIIFLLLIFFLLTSSFVVRPGIEVQLPSSEESKSKADEQIVLSITSTGHYYVNEKKFSFEEISTQLALLLGDNKEKTIVINADKNVSLQTTVEVMDIAKNIGASHFLIATQQNKKARQR
ncbi:MAG: biopolymer transporter ExbD [Bacteroidota bacterium]